MVQVTIQIQPWMEFNARKRQQALMETLPPNISKVIQEWGTGDEALALLTMQGLRSDSVHKLLTLLGNVILADVQAENWEYLDSLEGTATQGGSGDPVPTVADLDALARRMDRLHGRERGRRRSGWGRRRLRPPAPLL